MNQRLDIAQAARRIYTLEKVVLVQALFGKRVLLCNGVANDGRDDSAVFGTSFEPKPDDIFKKEPD